MTSRDPSTDPPALPPAPPYTTAVPLKRSYLRPIYERSPRANDHTDSWWANPVETFFSAFTSVWLTIPSVAVLTCLSATFGAAAQSIFIRGDLAWFPENILIGFFVIFAGIFTIPGVILFVVTVASMFLLPYSENSTRRAWWIAVLCVLHFFNALYITSVIRL